MKLLKTLCLLLLLSILGVQAWQIKQLEQKIHSLKSRIVDLESFAQCSDLYHVQKDSHDWMTVTKGGLYVR